eukprot:1156479-Pelagomonas_calceolata.AAC.7
MKVAADATWLPVNKIISPILNSGGEVQSDGLEISRGVTPIWLNHANLRQPLVQHTRPRTQLPAHTFRQVILAECILTHLATEQQAACCSRVALAHGAGVVWAAPANPSFAVEQVRGLQASLLAHGAGVGQAAPAASNPNSR